MPGNLRVLTFNVRHGTDLVGRPALADQAAIMHDADIVLIQELDCGTARSEGHHQLEDLKVLAGFDHSAFGANLAYQGGWYGTGILSRHRIRRTGNLILPTLATGSTQDTDGKLRTVAEKRGVLWAELDTPTGEMLVAVHHASLWAIERRAACAMLAAMMHTYPGRVLLGGDLNTKDEDELELLRECGQEIDGGELTYPSDDPVMRIDRLFVKGFEIISSSVPSTTVSDHRPLFAVIR